MESALVYGVWLSCAPQSGSQQSWPAVFSLEQGPVIMSRCVACEKAAAGLSRVGFAWPCEQITAFHLLVRATEQRCFTIMLLGNDKVGSLFMVRSSKWQFVF